MFLLDGSHWFKDFKRAWLVLTRAECSCGHLTRAYWSLDKASSALIRHQAASGTRVP